jgi:antitoxin HicB
MGDFAYPVVLDPAAEGGFVVSFPDIPEAITQGEDEAEALARAQDALETALEFYVEEGQALPRPSRPKRGQRVVEPPAIASMKLAVYAAMSEGHVRKTDLARRLGWHLMQVDRLLDLHHASRVEQIEAALGAMNRRLAIRVDKQPEPA